LAEGVLRCRAGDPQTSKYLLKAVNKIYSIYGLAAFDVTVTANLLLKANESNSWSVFYGQVR
jgi:hypothetical protein